MPVYMMDNRVPVWLTDEEVEYARMALEDADPQDGSGPNVMDARLILRSFGFSIEKALCAVAYARQHTKG